MYALIIGLGVLIVFWVIEYHRHQYYRRKIPHIIHVNGTRGKSSVTRLIAAGLRAGNYNTLAKTTGSEPAFIFENGSETRLVRYFGANIKEQLKIIKFVAKRKVDYLVLECMAVNPEYQWVTEHKMVKADICVITNSRLDHLDVMGPGIRNVTLSLCNTLPRNGVAFTAERKLFPLIKKEANHQNVKISSSDPEDVNDDDMKGFGWIEHKENVALALKLCDYCGVNRDEAIRGMWNSKPDIGAAEIFTVSHKGKKIFFAHSFAANDPESTLVLIKNIIDLHKKIKSVVILLNTRADRMFRSKQLIEMLADFEHDHLILVGQQTNTIKSYALAHDLVETKIHDIGWASGEDVLKTAENFKEKEILIFGIGNIGGNGGILMQYFKERNEKYV